MYKWLAGGSGDTEYVASDAARTVIAVVRPVEGRPSGGVPRWADAKECAVVVVGPDGAAGLVITRRGFSREARVLVEPKSLVGMVERDGGTLSLLTFRDCTCGQPRRKCICGARSGSLRPSSKADRAWTVVDPQHCELGHITARPLAQARGQTRPAGMGSRLGHWATSAARSLFPVAPRVCELVEVDTCFDWRRHGLLVALAAVCDPVADRLALPTR